MDFDLVFEGGGAKGMVFVGALEEFEARGYTADRLLGTSAGAITAALLAAGYSSGEMLAALDEKEGDRPVFAGFMGEPDIFEDVEVRDSATLEFLRSINVPMVPRWVEVRLEERIVRALLKRRRFRHLFSFVERGGWYEASRFVSWMMEKLDTKSPEGQERNFGQMNLAEFFSATNRELCVIASDTTDQRILVLNHRTAPECPLVWAVRMSMSIPLLWQEVEWQPGWGRYRGETMEGHTVVDGGLLSNFPIELLISTQPHVMKVMGRSRSDKVLGLLIDENLPVEGAPFLDPQESGIEWGKLRTVRRITQLIDTMTSAHDKEVFEAFEHLVVRLPARGYGTTEFDMSEGRREALVSAGRSAMKEFFARREAGPSARPRGFGPSEEEKASTSADRIATGILGKS